MKIYDLPISPTDFDHTLSLLYGCQVKLPTVNLVFNYKTGDRQGFPQTDEDARACLPQDPGTQLLYTGKRAEGVTIAEAMLFALQHG